MDAHQTVEMLVEVAGKFGIECRTAPLGGSGGTMATLKGKQVFFIDAEAEAADQAHAIGAALADLDGLEDIFLIPQLRQFIEQCRSL